MAKYTRIEITALCKRLENRANSIVSVQPAMSGDMLAAAMLLRMMVVLADVEEIDTAPKLAGRAPKLAPD